MSKPLEYQRHTKQSLWRELKKMRRAKVEAKALSDKIESHENELRRKSDHITDLKRRLNLKSEHITDFKGRLRSSEHDLRHKTRLLEEAEGRMRELEMGGEVNLAQEPCSSCSELKAKLEESERVRRDALDQFSKEMDESSRQRQQVKLLREIIVDGLVGGGR